MSHYKVKRFLEPVSFVFFSPRSLKKNEIGFCLPYARLRLGAFIHDLVELIFIFISENLYQYD